MFLMKNLGILLSGRGLTALAKYLFDCYVSVFPWPSATWPQLCRQPAGAARDRVSAVRVQHRRTRQTAVELILPNCSSSVLPSSPHFSQALIWGCGGVLGELGRPFFDDDIVPWRFWSQRMAWFTLRRGFFGRAPPNNDGIAGGSVVV